MHTKTATAVVLALLGGAKAGDADPQPTDLDETDALGLLHPHACAGDVLHSLLGDGGNEWADSTFSVDTASITDAFSCFFQAGLAAQYPGDGVTAGSNGNGIAGE